MATCIKSLGSRTWKISVSTIFFGSRLNEYCTVENQACAGELATNPHPVGGSGIG